MDGIYGQPLDRSTLSALANCLIFDGGDTFRRIHAMELARLLPIMSSRAAWHTSHTSSNIMRRTSPKPSFDCIHNVTRGEEAYFFDLDRRGRQVVRAGQWQFHRTSTAIEIEQITAAHVAERRTARLEMDGDEPTRLSLLMATARRIGPFSFSKDAFRPWKVPA